MKKKVIDDFLDNTSAKKSREIPLSKNPFS